MKRKPDVEINDKKSTRGLAAEYEEDYLKAADPAAKTAAETKEVRVWSAFVCLLLKACAVVCCFSCRR